MDCTVGFAEPDRHGLGNSDADGGRNRSDRCKLKLSCSGAKRCGAGEYHSSGERRLATDYENATASLLVAITARGRQDVIGEDGTGEFLTLRRLSHLGSK